MPPREVRPVADGYDKRVLRDDDAIVFCKTGQTFPEQGGAVIDNGIRVDRDKVKPDMAAVLESLAKKACDAGIEALEARQEGSDAKAAVKEAHKKLRDAFLCARLTQATLQPSEVMERLVSDLSLQNFLRGRGRVQDTGLGPLHAALGEIF